MTKKRALLYELIPFFVNLVLCIAVVIAYTALHQTRDVLDYLELGIAALIPLACPVISLITKRPMPIGLNVLATALTALSMYLGTAFDFYGKFSWWDLFLHGTFGFVCAAFVLHFLTRWGGSALSPFGKVAIVLLFTLGCAAVWEVWEYICNMLFHNDPQGVAAAIEKGISPIADTMEDIMIAAAGAALFGGVALIDRLTKGKVFRLLYKITEYPQ